MNTTAWLTSIDYSDADPWVSYPRLRSVRGTAVLAGELVVHHSLSLCDFGHQGLMHDEATGLIYNRARMRHPELGRFMQRDPLGYVDGMNVYCYLKGNMQRYLDPKGSQSELHVVPDDQKPLPMTDFEYIRTVRLGHSTKEYLSSRHEDQIRIVINSLQEQCDGELLYLGTTTKKIRKETHVTIYDFIYLDTQANTWTNPILGTYPVSNNYRVIAGMNYRPVYQVYAHAICRMVCPVLDDREQSRAFTPKLVPVRSRSAEYVVSGDYEYASIIDREFSGKTTEGLAQNDVTKPSTPGASSPIANPYSVMPPVAPPAITGK